MEFSVGFENGEQIVTWVMPEAAKPGNQFYFNVIPAKRFWLGALVIVGAFLVFLYLARCTDIIRDTTAPLRPDKRWPYSLSRARIGFLVFSRDRFVLPSLGDHRRLRHAQHLGACLDRDQCGHGSRRSLCRFGSRPRGHRDIRSPSGSWILYKAPGQERSPGRYAT